MKLQEANFYEKYWKGHSNQNKDTGSELVKGIARLRSKEPLFEELPVWGNMEEELRKRVNFFSAAIRGKILDAGCGLGDWVFHLAKFDGVDRAVGIDISETVIKKSVKKSRGKKLQNKTKFIAGSLDSLPFKDSSFDSIFSLEVAEHVLDVNSMFAEFNRVLKKGGYLGISTVDFNLLKMIIIGIFFFEKYFDPRSPHIRFFTKKTLEKMLDKNGFKVIDYKWIRSYFGIMPMGQMVLAQKNKDI